MLDLFRHHHHHFSLCLVSNVSHLFPFGSRCNYFPPRRKKKSKKSFRGTSSWSVCTSIYCTRVKFPKHAQEHNTFFTRLLSLRIILYVISLSVFLALSFYCLIFLQFPAQTTSLFEFCFCQYTKSFFLRVFFVLEARYTFASTLPTHFAHLISTHPPLFQHLKDLDSRQGGGNRSNKRIGTLTVVRVDNGNIIAHMEACSQLMQSCAIPLFPALLCAYQRGLWALLSKTTPYRIRSSSLYICRHNAMQSLRVRSFMWHSSPQEYWQDLLTGKAVIQSVHANLIELQNTPRPL